METTPDSQPGRTKPTTSLKPFFRLLGYVWKQKRYLIPAVGCVIFMACTYSASLGSILPLLTALMGPIGLHGWVDQTVAQDRLGCEFVLYDPQREKPIEKMPENTARLLKVHKSSPLRVSANNPLTDAYIVGVEVGDGNDAHDVRGPAGKLFPILAVAPKFKIYYCYRQESGEAGPIRTLDLQPNPPKYSLQLLRRAVGYIPGGTTPSEKWRTLVVVLAFLGILTLAGNIARFLAEYLTVVVNCRAIMDLRRKLYAQVMRLPLSHFSRNTTDTMSRFAQDTAEIFRGLSNFFEKIVTEPFKAVGAAVVAFKVDWQLTLAALLATPVIVLIVRQLGKKIRRANRKLLATYSQMLGALESTLTGMRVVKGYGGEHYERRRLFRIDRTVLGYQLKMGRTEALAAPYMEMFGFLAVAGAILYLANGIFLRGAGMEMPKVLTLVFCLAAIFDPIRKVSAVYPKIQRASAAADRVFELLDRPNEYAGDAARPRVQPLQHDITFQGICFTYPESNRPALRDINLSVRKGETVALVGPNGSGKTTLVSLLPRFFPITEGRILIDGQDINEVSLRSLREQFSLITQESVIFPDSVRANIAYGLSHASDADIESAACKAFADEFIRQMPEGYDTVVGEHGATLSGGQRQRLAIARAILRNAPILIFDEATAQVDPESEMKIHEALEGFLKGRTAFVIAHRYSTVRDADRIAVMEDGEIVAIGTHDELLKTCPLYGRLYEAQFRSNGATDDEIPGSDDSRG